MCYKQGILKSLESLSGKRGKKNPHNSGLGGEHGSFLANKKKNVGENVRPSKLLYSQNPEPRLVVLGEQASGYHGVFFYLDNSLPQQALRQLK